MRRLYRNLALGLTALLLLLGAVGTAAADGPVHVVQPGETLFRIALNYGVSMDAIRAANGFTGDTIYAGQTLIIPDGSTPPDNNPPPASGGNVIHVVQRGETLFTIGLQYGITWDKIAAANHIVGNTIYAGQQLIIPLGGAADAPPPAPTGTPPTDTPPTPPAATEPAPAPTDAPPANPPPDSSGNTIHIVQAGETLYLIGQQYGVSWLAIQQVNKLVGTTIYAGQQLIIPAPGTVPDPVPGGGDTGGLNVPPPPAENAGGKRFLVVLSQQRLYAYDGDRMVRTTLISSGVAAHPTVVGTFHIYARYVSTEMIGPGYDLPNVPYTQYFYQGYGLHGTYWHHNFGTPMSHGCVNMPTDEAEWAFNWATYGTPVIVVF